MKTISEDLQQFLEDVYNFMQDAVTNFTYKNFASRLMLIDAIKYVIELKGKLLRPQLVYAAYNLYSDIAEDSYANIQLDIRETLIKIAASIEFIHIYSLVHDDLPSMDNDDLRRGRATCHIKYNEAIAILVGDALQSLAFEILTNCNNNFNPKLQLIISNLIAKNIGVDGMVGGQALDILQDLQEIHNNNNADNNNNIISNESDVYVVSHKELLLKNLRYMHLLKTAALIKAAILSGYLCAKNNNYEFLSNLNIRNITDDTQESSLHNFANNLGLLFQIIDDIIDCTSNTKELGKTACKDIDANKLTYVNLLGLNASKTIATDLYNSLEQYLLKYAIIY